MRVRAIEGFFKKWVADGPKYSTVEHGVVREERGPAGLSAMFCDEALHLGLQPRAWVGRSID